MLDSKVIDDTYDKYGPIPRLCIQIASDSDALGSYENDTSIALDELTLQSFQELVHKLQKLKMPVDDISYNICLIKRQDISNVRSRPYVTPITDHIQSRITIQMRNLDSLQQVKYYHAFAHTPSRGAAGPIFEAFCQQQFQTQIHIEHMPMIQLAKHDDSQSWYTGHLPFEDLMMERLRQKTLCQVVTLNIRPSTVYEYNDQDLKGLNLTPGVYYLPSTQNMIALDSFIFHGGFLYLFQFTISGEHKIDAKFTSLFTHTNFPPISKWRIIFVIPDDVKVLTCPYSQSQELQSIIPFSSKIKMEEYLELTGFKE